MRVKNFIQYAMTISDMKKGQSAKILSINVDGAARERLKSLGFCKGKRVMAAAFSFLNGSILLLCGYNRVAIRRSVAAKIEVELCPQ